MTRDTYITACVQKAVMDAALELWKEDIQAGRKIIEKALADIKMPLPHSELHVSNAPSTGASQNFLSYKAILPDGTEEELKMLGFSKRYYSSSCYAEVNVSWDDINLLEELSQKAILVEQILFIIRDATMDTIKKKYPWLMKFFDVAYESWKITYRAVSAFEAFTSN